MTDVSGLLASRRIPDGFLAYSWLDQQGGEGGGETGDQRLWSCPSPQKAKKTPIGTIEEMGGKHQRTSCGGWTSCDQDPHPSSEGSPHNPQHAPMRLSIRQLGLPVAFPQPVVYLWRTLDGNGKVCLFAERKWRTVNHCRRVAGFYQSLF